MTKHKGQHRPGQHTAEGQAVRAKRLPATVQQGSMPTQVHRSSPDNVLALLKRAKDAISGKNKS